MKRYLEGLRFGLLLQFAVGPMCLMVFNTAKKAILVKIEIQNKFKNEKICQQNTANMEIWGFEDFLIKFIDKVTYFMLL